MKGESSHVKEFRARFLKLLRNPAYWNRLEIQLNEGTLHPTLHSLLYHHVLGKPPETIRLEEEERDITKLSRSELRDRLVALQTLLDDMDDETGESVH